MKMWERHGLFDRTSVLCYGRYKHNRLYKIPTEHKDLKDLLVLSVERRSMSEHQQWRQRPVTWMAFEHGGVRTGKKMKKKRTESLTTLPVTQHLSRATGFRAVCRPHQFLGEFVLRAAEVQVELLSVYRLAESPDGFLQTLLWTPFHTRQIAALCWQRHLIMTYKTHTHTSTACISFHCS